MDLSVEPRLYQTLLVKAQNKTENKKRLDYKSELLNVYPSLYFTYIFLRCIHFKLFFSI
jgi:hypothetical protein